MKAPACRRAAAAVAALSPELRAVLLVAAVLHGVGLSWGMPASDGWDVDGIAPRDVLPGLAQTYTPGLFYTYPPLHLALLAALTLPVTIAAMIGAGTTSLDAVIHEILLPPYMTTIAMIARVVSLVMSLGIAIALAKMAEELAPEGRKRTAGAAVALVASTGAPLTYYAHVTNLDVPYLFWAWLAALAVVQGIARGEPTRIRRAAVLAALAVTTKDQAYAMFAIALPVLLGSWAIARRADAKAIAKHALVGGAIALAVLLVVDGAITNPSGLRARLAFLGGSASQDFATYSKDATGRWLVVVDTLGELRRHYHPIVGLLAAGGLVDAVWTGRRQRRLLVALAPLLLAVSFTVTFNMVARRVEERFTLPQALAAAFYAGFALERVWSTLGWVGRAAAAALALAAGWQALLVDATMLREPRYAAEQWLGENARPGDLIEAHGLNVYLPRFPPGPRVIRVAPEPPDKRNPMPGVEEVQAKLSAIHERRPRFVVVNECYAWRFLERDLGGTEGRIVPKTQLYNATDADATALFQGLFHGRLGYRVAKDWRIDAKVFPPKYELHASLGCPIVVFERDRPEPRP